MPALPFLFAGDRSIAVDALQLLADRGAVPRVLCVEDGPGGTHAGELVDVYTRAGGRVVLPGSAFADPAAVAAELGEYELDFALSVHFARMIRRPVLEAPRRGWLNLHPSYLPWNQGWHTPSWAIMDGTPAGASLHRMVEEVDAGSVLRRVRVETLPQDTAHTLYQRILRVELELLADVWDDIVSDEWPDETGQDEVGTAHRRSELFSPDVQELDLDAMVRVGDLLDRLRALTTNRPAESAWFRAGDDTVRVRVTLDLAEAVGDRVETGASVPATGGDAPRG